ncbi:MAG: hypothetical protein Q8R92_08600 [Deltaproteobacteria bacterium]|nr:hypothetical protein [Deltaproteobacteria bacterium]
MDNQGPNPLSGVTRRDLLKLTLGAGALGLAAPLLPGCGPAPDAPARPANFSHLSDLEYAVFHKAAPVVLPPPGDGLPDYRQVPVFDNLDRFFGSFPDPVRKQVADGLRLFEYGAIVIGWHFRSFTRLSDDDARGYILRWRTGNAVQKAVYQVLTRALISCYWQAPVTWKSVGYAGPLYLRETIPSLGNAPLPTE